MLAKLDEPGVDVALQQEVAVLLAIVEIHAAAGMAGGLVALVELVVLFEELERTLDGDQLGCRAHARRWLRSGAKRCTGIRTGTQARQWSQ
jgi:hypothetical protein